MANNSAEVILWERTIGAVTWSDDRRLGTFQYNPDFLNSGIQLSPLVMPLNEFPYEFPELNRNTFRGLPGLLADSLPDKFGNRIIAQWLASQNRTFESFNPVEQLCYTGNRGMGALEFRPALLGTATRASVVDVAKLVELSNRILDERNSLHGVFDGSNDPETIKTILRVGTSAGGARAKAILAWNPKTNEFRSGQVSHLPTGFEYWIMKFDGIHANKDKELADPQGYGKIEFAYHQLALRAGIEMSPCRLHHENGRSHFMTRRFDRLEDGTKVHMQSLCALTHADFNQAQAYSYEETIVTMKRLGLSRSEQEQMVLRAMFNIVGRNQDDHVKNIAFLMGKKGEWRLAPAFDISYSFDPSGKWTREHQMTLNGRGDNFSRADLYPLAANAGIKKRKTNDMLDKVVEVICLFPKIAGVAGVDGQTIERIQKVQRLDW